MVSEDLGRALLDVFENINLDEQAPTGDQIRPRLGHWIVALLIIISLG